MISRGILSFWALCENRQASEVDASAFHNPPEVTWFRPFRHGNDETRWGDIFFCLVAVEKKQKFRERHRNQDWFLYLKANWGQKCVFEGRWVLRESKVHPFLKCPTNFFGNFLSPNQTQCFKRRLSNKWPVKGSAIYVRPSISLNLSNPNGKNAALPRKFCGLLPTRRWDTCRHKHGQTNQGFPRGPHRRKAGAPGPVGWRIWWSVDAPYRAVDTFGVWHVNTEEFPRVNYPTIPLPARITFVNEIEFLNQGTTGFCGSASCSSFFFRNLSWRKDDWIDVVSLHVDFLLL